MNSAEPHAPTTYICKECGETFTLSESEIAWFVQRFGPKELPRRCRPCRQLRRELSPRR